MNKYATIEEMWKWDGVHAFYQTGDGAILDCTGELERFDDLVTIRTATGLRTLSRKQLLSIYEHRRMQWSKLAI